MSIEQELIIAKVGSTSIADKVHGLREDRVESVAENVSRLRELGAKVILVVSGAAYTGEAFCRQQGDLVRHTPQMYAGVGAARVAVGMQDALARHGIIANFEQVSHHEVDDRIEGRVFLDATQEALDDGILPVINANDVVSTDELIKNGWGDNDGLSAHIGQALNADRLLLTTDVRGLLRCGGKYLVHQVMSEADHSAGIYSYQEALGFAGYVEGQEPDNSMSSKMKAAYDFAQQGGVAHIAAASANWLHILEGRVGTTIAPASQSV